MYDKVLQKIKTRALSTLNYNKKLYCNYNFKIIFKRMESFTLICHGCQNIEEYSTLPLDVGFICDMCTKFTCDNCMEHNRLLEVNAKGLNWEICESCAIDTIHDKIEEDERKRERKEKKEKKKKKKRKTIEGTEEKKAINETK